VSSPSYPASLDALANPAPTTETDDTGFELDLVIGRLQNCVMAIEQKLGIGAGGPGATAAVLRRTANGVSSWGQLQSGDIAAGQAPVLLATSGVLGGVSTGFSFSGITQAFAHLELRMHVRSTHPAVTDSVIILLNGDNGAHYYGQRALFAGATATMAETGPSSTFANIGYMPGASALAGLFGVLSVMLPNYSGASGYKSMLSTGAYNYGNVAGNTGVTLNGNTWLSAGTLNITSLFVGSSNGQNFVAGSILSLYGWN
jgi:hypothetical protein